MSRRATYRVYLFGKRGFAKVKNAVTYEVKYGRRVVVSRRSIPKQIKKVSERREFFELLVEKLERKKTREQNAKRKERERKAQELERKRLERNKKARERYRQRREEATRVKEELERAKDLEAQRKVEEEKAELAEEARLKKLYPTKYLLEVAEAVLDYDKVRTEPAQTLRNITISDTLVTPIIPDGSIFKREQIDKTIIYGPEKIARDIAILNMTLNEEDLIPVTKESINESFQETFYKFWPHMILYWLETKDSSDSYLFRLKFKFEHDASYVDHGISVGSSARIDIDSKDYLKDVFQRTFKRLMGENYRETISLKGKRKRFGARDYLADDALIFITGFTLESAVDRKI